jgi:CRP-like cAMP-binding protein
LLKLSYCFEEKILTKDQILFKEGDSLDFIYFIKEGEVKLSRKIKIQMINSFEPVTKGTLFLKKHCWKSADVGVLESGGLIGINDLENEKHSVSCKVCSKTAKILQVTLQNFRKRMNNDETLSVINHGKTMRNLLIQDNTKSATKILKDRIFSPYKQLFAEETLNKPSKIDLVGKTPKNNEKVSRPSRRKSSSYEDINEKVPKFATFDVNSKVKQEIYKNSRRIRTTAPVGSKDSSRLNSEADDARKAVRSRISQRKTKSMDHEDHSSTSIKKRKCNISYLIMKMNPFGKTKSVNPTPKIEEVVNMHVQSKKNLSIRPNTPKNWSFMNFNSPIRRPISTLCRIKDT